MWQTGVANDLNNSLVAEYTAYTSTISIICFFKEKMPNILREHMTMNYIEVYLFFISITKFTCCVKSFFFLFFLGAIEESRSEI